MDVGDAAGDEDGLDAAAALELLLVWVRVHRSFSRQCRRCTGRRVQRVLQPHRTVLNLLLEAALAPPPWLHPLLLSLCGPPSTGDLESLKRLNSAKTKKLRVR